jgi:hypothetical protein
LARFAGRDLARIVQTIGSDSDHTTATELPAGSTLVAFFEVKIPDGIPVPRQLAHRIVLDNTAVTVGLSILAGDLLKFWGARSPEPVGWRRTAPEAILTTIIVGDSSSATAY